MKIVTLIYLFVFIYNFFFPVEGIGYNFDYSLETFANLLGIII